MGENKTIVTTKISKPTDCVTQIHMENTFLVVNGFFKENTTETAADKMEEVLAAEREMI